MSDEPTERELILLTAHTIMVLFAMVVLSFGIAWSL